MPEATNRKCLVVDDDPLLVNTLVEMLITISSYEACGIVFKGNSNELLNQIHTESYDILILGIMMPGINGLDLLKRIRIQGLNIPIMLMTGFNIPIRAIESMRSGADDLIIKPFGIDDLNSSIDTIFAHRNHNPNQYRKTMIEEPSLDRSPDFTGKIKEYYNSGEIMAELSYKKGKLDGFSKVYRKWKIPLAEVSFRDGLADGRNRWFKADGQVHIVDDYKGDETPPALCNK